MGREFAGADALRQAVGERGDLLLAVIGDELAEDGAERGVGEGVDVDAVEHRLGERFADVDERSAARVSGSELFQRQFGRRQHWLAFYGGALRLATRVFKKG